MNKRVVDVLCRVINIKGRVIDVCERDLRNMENCIELLLFSKMFLKFAAVKSFLLMEEFILDFNINE
jgi:hypothetical protein